MEYNEKAKILLSSGSFSSHVQRVFEENDIIPEELANILYNKVEEAKEEYDKWAIRSNWSEMAHEFLADGYSRNDIDYDDYEELENDLIIDAVLEMAEEFVEKFFNNDKDMLNDVQKYIESCL